MTYVLYVHVSYIALINHKNNSLFFTNISSLIHKKSDDDSSPVIFYKFLLVDWISNRFILIKSNKSVFFFFVYSITMHECISVWWVLVVVFCCLEICTYVQWTKKNLQIILENKKITHVYAHINHKSSLQNFWEKNFETTSRENSVFIHLILLLDDKKKHFNYYYLFVWTIGVFQELYFLEDFFTKN